MTKHYRFECIDDEDSTSTIVEFSTENDSWHGYDGPVYKFHDFLKGCGFIFDINTEIGFMDEDGQFENSTEWA